MLRLAAKVFFWMVLAPVSCGWVLGDFGYRCGGMALHWIAAHRAGVFYAVNWTARAVLLLAAVFAGIAVRARLRKDWR